MSEEKLRQKSHDDKEVDITFAISLQQYGSVRLKSPYMGNIACYVNASCVQNQNPQNEQSLQLTTVTSQNAVGQKRTVRKWHTCIGIMHLFNGVIYRKCRRGRFQKSTLRSRTTSTD